MMVSMKEQKLFLPVIADLDDKKSPLKNRIRKNYRHLRKMGMRTMTNCFRIYDRDIKMYPIAIDFYAGRFCVQYFTSSRDCDDPSPELKNEIIEQLCSLFDTKVSDIYFRSRVKRRKLEQYEKIGEKKEFFNVLEYGATFKVNLQDYLDTGLFLDHRETRQIVASCCRGKRLLNLFSYTGSFSLHAALGGATFTKSVDLSNTYTEWNRDNFDLNAISEQDNQVIATDCLEFLIAEQRSSRRYDVIVIDPPTISRSKKMQGLFDIQQDYPFLIKNALQLLSKGGVIFFSTNSRKFKFDTTLFSNVHIQDISAKTIPEDFHQKKIHYCWKLTKA